MNETALFLVIVAALVVANLLNQLVFNPVIFKLFRDAGTGGKVVGTKPPAISAKTTGGMGVSD